MFEITVDGFRGFNKNPIILRDLNVLIGENSGGKSSFIKLLLLLKQSMEVANKDKKINSSGTLVDLGRFDNFINQSKENKKFSISFLLNNINYRELYYKYLGKTRDTEEEFYELYKYFLDNDIKIRFEFDKETNNIFTANIYIECSSIGKLTLVPKENTKFSVSGVEGQICISHNKLGELKIDDVFTVQGFTLLATPSQINNFIKEKELSQSLFYEIAYLLIAQNYIAEKLYSLKYINPVKFQPHRIILKKDMGSSHFIGDYESFIDALAYFIELEDDISVKIIDQFKIALKEIGIAEDIKLDSNKDIPVSQLQVKVGGVWSSIVDVGYGVGLQIPILFQTIISSILGNKDIIMIEQPEIHLHPKLHAKFIEVLLKYSGNSKFIIETHSEHILRKLQVMVKNQQVNNKTTMIYYFKNAKGNFDISKHSLNEEGKLEPLFPKGFYDNSYLLVEELY